MSTTEFIIVGQDQGTGYVLWDIAPAPTDPTTRATKLEEIGVDAHDAFGEVTTVYAADEDAALIQFCEDLRKQSGLNWYAIVDMDDKTRATAGK